MSAYAGAESCDADLQAQVKAILPQLKTKYPPLKDKTKDAALKTQREDERVALLADQAIRDLLLKTASDPGMRGVQDMFFYDGYMKRTLKAWKDKGFKYALSAAVAHDSCIQSGEPWDYIPSFKGDPRTVAGVAADQAVGPATAENEKEWVKAYVAGRKKWLSESSSEFTRASVYRCELFEKLIAAGNWDLDLPLMGHGGYEITVWDNFPLEAFTELERDSVRRGDFESFGEFRRVKVKEGRLVPWSGKGFFIRNCLTLVGALPRQPAAAGRFDAVTEEALKKFQKEHGLEPTGVFDLASFEVLCDETSKIVGDPRRQPGPGTSEGLTYIPETTRRGTPVVSGGLAGAAVVVAVGGGAALSVTNDADQAAQHKATVDKQVETLGVEEKPVFLGFSQFEIATLGVAVAFIAAIWITAIFFRRWSE
jgi:peptidoglycan hydrolase-like protein with peptidoglycan-binding domain